jgi:carbamoyl-phosphate synthase large subunit
MKNLRVLFLGASRAVGLLERFQSAAAALDVGLEMFSCDDPYPWHPVVVAGLAQPVQAPPADAPEFSGFLTDFVRRNAVDIVVPNIDEATIALARAGDELRAAGALPIVSSLEVCATMTDKRQAELLFRSLGLPTPSGTGYPLLAKPRYGAGSRGIVTLHDASELEHWRRRNNEQDFLLQALVSGPEFTIDGYVDRSGRLLGLVSRVRVSVMGGEVAITCTRRNGAALALSERLLQWNRWFGPVTVQVVLEGEDAYVLECNPRIAGGATCSIEAGLAVPEWILRERLDLPLPGSRIVWQDDLCMTRSLRDHFLSTRPAPPTGVGPVSL